MSIERLNSSRLAQCVRSQIRRKLKKLTFTLGFGVVQVGKGPVSTLYIKHKQRDCEKVHFPPEVHRLPANISQEIPVEQIEA